ncbi:DUF4153 domain-containing protein [Herbaspirillum sp. RV1423]|uniref:DUF4153 domain-containing protein n=1 Tax=Herbaspirillum sp. RV1423 TaxID=1443993 RepID=UPI001E42E0B4|nr:DUF4153 domain-containing protein [Herbaspirillum sp. RV1423]
MQGPPVRNDMENDGDALRSPVSLPASRLRISLGLAQGLLLYALYASWTAKIWLSSQPTLFIPAVMIALFLPIIAVSGIGHLSRRNLLVWLGMLAIILGALGCYDGWRTDLSSLLPSATPANDTAGDRNGLPSGALFMLTATGLFIAQAMILAGNADGKRIASYRSYFEMAWKLLVQLLFAALFTGLFWLVLETGNALFSLIRLDFLNKLIDKSWFHIPVTTLAFSFALHLSDVRPQLIAGIRKLLLTLLSWLLPVATIVIGAFLLSILATGLEPLWQTRRASQVLLGAAALLVVLINTVFQDGRYLDRATHRFFLLCMRVACLLPTPLVLLAVYSMGLRVAEYGWTVSRIAGAVCALIAAMYALGYGIAAIRRGEHLQRVATTNVAASFAILLIFVALLSPLANPERIAVASQLARLDSGKIEPARFDFHFLRFGGDRYGVAELIRLSKQQEGAQAALIRKEAVRALAAKNQWPDTRDAGPTPDLGKNIRMHPAGRQLPREFAAQDWRGKKYWRMPTCMTQRDRQCDAYPVNPDPAGSEQILIFDSNNIPALFRPTAAGAWQFVGTLMISPACGKQLKLAAERGALRWQTPLQHDLEINGMRLSMQPEQGSADCQSADAQK